MRTRRAHLNTMRNRRRTRTRAKIFGTAERPRLSVFRSSTNVFLQLIDDMNGRTIASASTRELPKDARKKKKTQQAELVAAILAKKAKEMNIQKAVFDRSHYAYHGRVRAIADAVRKEIHM